MDINFDSILNTKREDDRKREISFVEPEDEIKRTHVNDEYIFISWMNNMLEKKRMKKILIWMI